MKKSTAYSLTQIAVVNSPCISPENKIEILKILIEDEELALFIERQKEQAVDAE